MGKLLQIAVAVIFIATVSACASSGDDKWKKDDTSAQDANISSSNWQKEQEPEDNAKKASSSYWNEQNRY